MGKKTETRVLIVDDNSDNLYLLRNILENQDWEVSEAQNGQVALEMALAQPPDMIVSDILMPVMDGFTFCRKCKAEEKLKNIPFAFYTATYTEPKDEKFALDIGADRFILKPQEPDILIDILTKLLEEKRSAKPAATQPMGDEEEFLRRYNEILFSKLEKKSLAVEKAKEEWFPELEQLISALSTDLSGAPVSEIDGKIAQALKQIRECLNIDRVTLWKLAEEGTEIQCLHQHVAPEFKNAPHDVTNKNFPVLFNQVISGDYVCFSGLEDFPEKAKIDKEFFYSAGGKSTLIIPYRIAGKIITGMTFASVKREKKFPAPLVSRLKLAGEIISSALYRRQAEEMYSETVKKLRKLGDFTAGKLFIRQDKQDETFYQDIIGKSAAMQTVFSRVEQVASTDATVLILGETGTGKDVIARAIHEISLRRKKKMVTVNCAALPQNLMESELFGREKGAFTGADTRQIGRFEIADDSTICLDEIGELSMETQAKLLRVIQYNEFERLGSSQTLRVNVRIIATTNRDLEQEVRQGRFRQDLYYRLNVFPITVPPLRQRRDDIPLLAQAFVEQYSRKLGKQITSVPEAIMKKLQEHPWPGNVRELESVIERAVILCPGPVLQLAENLESFSLPPSSATKTLEDMEKEQILKTLAETNWRIEGKNGSAEILGLHPSTLRARMNKFGIKRPTPKKSV